LGDSARYIYVAANVYRLPFAPGTFDAATMIRTIHHMADAPEALRQVRRSLQPGATFILEYANKQNLKAIARYLLRRQSWSPFSRDPIEFAALNFDFHPAAIRRWLKDSGFSVNRQLTVSHFRLGLLKRLAPVSLLVGLDSLAQLTGDLWQFSPSVFVQACAEGNTPVAGTGSIFLCPVCGHYPLREAQDSFNCPSCGRRWPYQDGIYDFRGEAGG
jgi:SAM-dependent methyltransferase